MLDSTCNTQQVDHCPETLQDILGAGLLLAWIFSPIVLICLLFLLWPLVHAVGNSTGRKRGVWIALLIVDALLVALFALLAASFYLR